MTYKKTGFQQLTLPTLLAASHLAVTPLSAKAENKAGVLEEVVVTATRKEQSLQEVPLAVSNMSSREMAAQGISTLSDVQPGTIPSVNFQTFVGTASMLQVAVRGIGIDDGSQATAELPVPIYIDGVYLGRSQGLGLELIDPERIEVLRGPQGQLFGRNAEGGVVQFITRKPTGEFGLRAKATHGEQYNARSYSLAVDLPSIGGLATTLSAIKSSHDPYTEQSDEESPALLPLTTYSAPGPNVGWGVLDAEGYRIAAQWAPENGRISVNYSYDDSDTFDSQSLPTYVPYDTTANENADTQPSDEFPDQSQYRQFHSGFDVIASGHNISIEYELTDNITLKTIASSRKAGRDGNSALGEAFIANGFNGLYVVAGETVESEQESLEVQAIMGWDNFDLTTGVTHYTEDVLDLRRAHVTGPFGVVAATLAGQPSPDPSLVQDNRQSAESSSKGIYAQGTYRPYWLDDRLELTLGLRYTDDEKDAIRFYTLENGSTDQRASFSTSRIDPAFTVAYHISNSMNAYLRYATGYRAGGVNVRSSSFTSYLEEVAETWELGIKSDMFSNAVRANAALFKNTIKNGQVTVQEDPQNNTSLTNTINSDDDKDILGLELELSWAISDSLTTGLNASFIDAKKFRTIDNPLTPENDPTRFYVIHTPEHSGSLYFNYQQPMDFAIIEARLSYSWSDDYHATPMAADESTLNPGFERPAMESSQLSFRGGLSDISLGLGYLSVYLWGKNLLDDASISFGFDGCASGGGLCAPRVTPRTYGVEVRYEL